MIKKIIAIQGDHPSKLNPSSDTSIFLASEIQSKNYKIFYYDPKYLSVINYKVIAKGFFIKIDYTKKKFFTVIKKKAQVLFMLKDLLQRKLFVKLLEPE